MFDVPKDYLASLWPALEAGTPVLTPNLRLSRALRQHVVHSMGAGDGRVMVTPPIHVTGAWIESQWRTLVELGTLPPARILSPLEAEELWLGIIQRDLSSSPQFSLLQPGAAAKAAQHSRELLLQYRSTVPAIKERFAQDEDCSRFYQWLEAFERQLAALRWLTPAGLETAVASDGVRLVDEVVVITDGSMTPVAHAALDRLAEKVTLVTLADAAPVDLVGRTYATVEDEQLAAAKWAADRYRRGLDSTAIVSLDLATQRDGIESALREAFDAVDARYDALPVNFSRGISSADAPVLRDALLVLRCLSAPIRRSDLLALIRSPYLTLLGQGDQRRAIGLIKRLFRSRLDPIPAADLRDGLRAMGESPLLRALDAVAAKRLLKHEGGGGEWRAIFLSLLVDLGWPRRQGLDSFEYQQIERLDEMMDQFESACDVCGSKSFPQAVSVFSRVLERRQFQPITSDNALQVLNDREVRGLRFDAVWLLGAQSSQLPKRPQLLPFIPAQLQRELGMPVATDPDGEIAARTLLNGLRAHAKELIVSWHFFDEGVEQVPSRLITPSSDIDSGGSARLDRWRRLLQHQIDMESIIDDRTVPIDPEGAAHRGGAALLADQSLCPFRAWVKQRLGVRQLDEPASGLTATERGNLLHLSLKLFWQRCMSSEGLRLLTGDQTRDLIAAAVSEAIHGVPTSIRRRVGNAALDVEATRLKQRLADWITLERSRDVGFEIDGLETEQFLTVGDLQLRLVIDRIDKLADGRRLVLDYKSSARQSVSALWGDRLREPQLPSYALLDERIEGVGWAVVSLKETKAVTLGEGLGFATDKGLASQLKDAEVNDWQQVRERWRMQLDNLASAFAEGHAEVDPMPRACEFCGLQPVCRIDETALPRSADVDKHDA